MSKSSSSKRRIGLIITLVGLTAIEFIYSFGLTAISFALIDTLESDDAISVSIMWPRARCLFLFAG